jgi:hypothetical protein
VNQNVKVGSTDVRKSGDMASSSSLHKQDITMSNPFEVLSSQAVMHDLESKGGGSEVPDSDDDEVLEVVEDRPSNDRGKGRLNVSKGASTPCVNGSNG